MIFYKDYFQKKIIEYKNNIENNKKIKSNYKNDEDPSHYCYFKHDIN